MIGISIREVPAKLGKPFPSRKPKTTTILLLFTAFTLLKNS
jgi:hypothetical protein